ncbi:MAG: methyltransferase [Candidatus Sumerlaeia bacterium]|nr:methyltransferase [Candidatus Sumerlaeia bacterium]
MMEIVLGKTDSERGVTEFFRKNSLSILSPKGLRSCERVLVDQLPEGESGRALVINSYGGILGVILKALNPDMQVVVWVDDAWDWEVAKGVQDANPVAAGMEVVLSAVLPIGPWDWVVYPTELKGTADLVRCRVRALVGEGLELGGRMLMSNENPRDRFIREELTKSLGGVHLIPEERRNGAVAYRGRLKQRPDLNAPNAEESFSLKDGDTVLEFKTTLGMFCHGRIDVGTVQLLKAMKVEGAQNILDLGCGCGVVGIVAALRNPQARVTMVDSHAPSVYWAEQNAVTAGVRERCEFLVSAQAKRDVAIRFDVVVTNPPYYGNLRISQLFLETAVELLNPGGRLCLVTKNPEWHEREIQGLFGNVELEERSGYWICTAVKK